MNTINLRKRTMPSSRLNARGAFLFSCHSYAVIPISLGTDIYNVSKMITHKNVTTTQIYANLVNSKELETANKISPK